jgi:hypothetical protein
VRFYTNVHVRTNIQFGVHIYGIQYGTYTYGPIIRTACIYGCWNSMHILARVFYQDRVFGSISLHAPPSVGKLIGVLTLVSTHMYIRR